MKYIFQKILSSLRQDVQVLILVNKESYCKKKKNIPKKSTQGQHSINIPMNKYSNRYRQHKRERIFVGIFFIEFLR